MKWKKREAELQQLLAKYGKKRPSPIPFPDLSVKQTHPSMSDGFAPIQERVQVLAQDHGQIVDTLHKQGMQVLFKDDLPYAGGKKS